METLADKLRSLGVRTGIPKPKPVKGKINFPVDSIISGVYKESIFGRSFIHQEHFSPDYQHGIVNLYKKTDFSVIVRWAGIENKINLDLQNILFLDTETSGLAGGTGTLVFMVGMGYQTAEGFSVEQYFLTNPEEEEAFLNAFSEGITSFSTLVTYNGKSFDAPLLNTRFDLNNLSNPILSLEHIDLLPLARRIWKYRLESRSLKNIETEILSISRNQEEIPGWEIPQIYFDYLRNEDARPLKGVFYHNSMDILSLAALFQYLSDLTSNPFEKQTPIEIDLMALARLFEDLGDHETANLYYEKSLSGSLPQDLRAKTRERFAKMNRNDNDWQKAAQVWQSGLEENDPNSLIELAKYYEHKEKMPEKAMAFAEQALTSTSADSVQSQHNQISRHEIQKRITRLRQKINKNLVSNDS